MARTTHDLVPLELAVRAVYQRVYEQKHRKAGIACTLEHLNGIAYAVAALLPLFTNDAQGFRRLSEDELLKGLFRDGGRKMVFIDGRAAIHALAVSANGVERVSQALSAADTN